VVVAVARGGGAVAVGQTVGHAAAVTVAERCEHVRCARGMRSTGGKNGGTAATSSGLAPRNGPNCFVFHFFVLLFIAIKHIVVVVFRNDYHRVVPATDKYLRRPSDINYIECSRLLFAVDLPLNLFVYAAIFFVLLIFICNYQPDI